MNTLTLQLTNEEVEQIVHALVTKKNRMNQHIRWNNKAIAQCQSGERQDYTGGGYVKTLQSMNYAKTKRVQVINGLLDKLISPENPA